MRPVFSVEDLDSDAVDPAEVAAAIAGLPVPDERKMEELHRVLAASEAAPTVESAWPPILEDPRRRADVRQVEPATSHRPLVGPALVAAKRTFRAVFQPFINEVLRRQVEFNESILNALAVMYEESRVQSRTQALWRDAIEARLDALERRSSSGAAEPPGRDPQKNGPPPNRG